MGSRYTYMPQFPLIKFYSRWNFVPMVHFTGKCLLIWPLSGNEAGDD